MYELPKKFFPHTVTYIYKDRGNRWSIDDDSEIRTTVHNVKVSANYSQRLSDNSIENNSKGVMYVHPNHSTFLDFEKGQEIEWQGEIYRIQTIHRFTQPYSEQLHHIRMELI